MSVNTQSFSQILSGYASIVQGAASVLVNFVIGSILRAIGEGTAWIAIWLQSLILNAIALTRAVTSSGADLDSWFAQFGFARLPPKPASGQVTFSRFTATQQAVILIGAFVQTGDGTQQYAVTIDTTNAAYNVSLGGYVIPAGTLSVSVPVVGVTPGNNSLSLPDASGNVSAGAISNLYQAISGVDNVTNALPFSNGINAESDPASRLRFVGYLASLARATKTAIGAAIQALGANYTFSLVENMTYAGLIQLGFFYVVIDDGSGNPPSPIVNTVSNAIDAVRPFTVTFGVFRPIIENAVVAMQILTTSTGIDHSATAAQVQLALLAYINTLTLGKPLSYFRLAQIALDVSADVIGIGVYTLNGGTTDMAATNQQVIKSSNVVVT